MSSNATVVRALPKSYWEIFTMECVGRLTDPVAVPLVTVSEVGPVILVVSAAALVRDQLKVPANRLETSRVAAEVARLTITTWC